MSFEGNETSEELGLIEDSDAKTKEELVNETEMAILEDIWDKGLQRRKELLRIVLFVLLVVLLALLIKRFVLQPIVINGESMSDTLHEDQIVLMDKLFYRFAGPKRQDIVVFLPYEGVNEVYAKRIIGLPGEVVYIDSDGLVHIADAYENGEYIGDRILEEPYVKETIARADLIQFGTKTNPAILGEDEYYVLGDNRNNSHDSRKLDVGVVHKSEMIGRLIFRLLPLKDFGTLE